MPRSQTIAQWAYAQSTAREPRLAVQIIFDASSPTITSKTGISNLPGTAIEGVISGVSSVSQQVWPDEGRATIGGCTITIMDNASPVNITQELLDQLENNGEGIRNKEIRVWRGFTDDFDDYERVGTFYADTVEYFDGVYKIRCRDKSRQLREYIHDPKAIRFSAALTATAGQVQTDGDPRDAGFQMVSTHAGWGNYPSETCGWILIKKTGEIIKYERITATGFKDITRGQFNTKAQAVEFDSDNPEEIEEFIYIEGPAMWAALATMTGVIDPDVSPRTMLPDHWHLGLDYDNDIDITEWEAIGTDLYDPDDLTEGFPVRGTYLERTQGKTFIEREIYRLAGVYAPTKADGTIGLRRVNKLVSKAPFVVTLDEDSITRYGGLKHDQSRIANRYEVNYNFNGEDLTRRVVIVDTESVNKHGASETRKIDFQLLHTAAHTQAAIVDRMLLLRDRYAEPPLTLRVDVVPPLDWLQLGDAVKLDVDTIRNYQDGVNPNLISVFEIQRVQNDWLNEKVSLDLFASSRLVDSVADSEFGGNPVDDSWYTGTGTNINTLTNYSSGNITGNETLTGSTTDINNSSSIWYHDGDLTIDAGAVLTIENNVQLRVAGFLTVNGKIDGKGNGGAGGVFSMNVGDAVTSDSYGNVTIPLSDLGGSGYLAGIQGGVGLLQVNTSDPSYSLSAGYYKMPIRAKSVEGSKTEIVRPTVSTAGQIVGKLPKNLMGTGGPTGAPLVHLPDNVSGPEIAVKGGAGGAGGAALALFCRGLGIGPTSAPDGIIDLSGEDGTAGAAAGYVGHIRSNLNYDSLAGSGAGGAPGMLVVYLDGDTVPNPNLTETNLLLNRGGSPLSSNHSVYRPIGGGFAGTAPTGVPINISYEWDAEIPDDGSALSPPGAVTGSRLWGKDDSQSAVSYYDEAKFVRYLPQEEDVDEDRLAAPQSLTATGGFGNVNLAWDFPEGADSVEVFASTTNDRSFSEEIYQGRNSTFDHFLVGGASRYYWIRVKQDNGEISEWFPESSTAGVQGIAKPAAPRANVWNYDFEDYDYVESDWVASGQTTIEQSSDSFDGSYAGLFTETSPFGGGANARRYFFSEGDTRVFRGRATRLTFWYKQPTTNASSNAAVSVTQNYSPLFPTQPLNYQMNSIDIEPGTDWQYAELVLPVAWPETTEIAIFVQPDTDGANGGVLIDNIGLSYDDVSSIPVYQYEGGPTLIDLTYGSDPVTSVFVDVPEGESLTPVYVSVTATVELLGTSGARRLMSAIMRRKTRPLGQTTGTPTSTGAQTYDSFYLVATSNGDNTISFVYQDTPGAGTIEYGLDMSVSYATGSPSASPPGAESANMYDISWGVIGLTK